MEWWLLAGPKGTLDIPVNDKVILNNLLMIKSMALIGEGIAYLPTTQAEGARASQTSLRYIYQN